MTKQKRFDPYAELKIEYDIDAGIEHVRMALLTARIVPKSSSRLMQLIGWLLACLRVNKRFMSHFWTTIGSTIYAPESAYWSNQLYRPDHGVVCHEMHHVWQWQTWGCFRMVVGYLFSPLPFLLSGRWLIERGPFLDDIKRGRRTVDQAVEILWSEYGWPWPRAWMRRWFLRKSRNCTRGQNGQRSTRQGNQARF